MQTVMQISHFALLQTERKSQVIDEEVDLVKFRDINQDRHNAGSE